MKFCLVVLAAAPIVSVGLYQENVAVVTRAVTPKDGSALVRVGAHEPFGVNLDHELTWEFDLDAGETREFKVECARWFAM